MRAALLLLVTWPALGQGLFTEAECRALSGFVRASAEVRDIGANLEKHVELLRARLAAHDTKLSPIVERELRRVYAERLSPEKAEQGAHTRCMSGEILRARG